MYRVLSLVIIVSRTLKFDMNRTTTKIWVVFHFYTCCFSTFLNCRQQPAKTLLLPLAKTANVYQAVYHYIFWAKKWRKSISHRKTKNKKKLMIFLDLIANHFLQVKFFRDTFIWSKKKYLLNLKIPELLTEMHTKTNRYTLYKVD